MNIAIIGGTGLLGSNLLKLYSEHNVRAYSREQSYNVDKLKNFTIDFNYLEDELNKFFIIWKPDIIINTVAIVNLQECEDDYSRAHYVNCEIGIKLAKISTKYNSYFIHISTDHYYGDALNKHNENDKIILVNNYAKTKYEAEVEIPRHNKNFLIVRTNIIGFRRRTAKSFFEWLLISLQEQEKINLYTNFFTSPISVKELGSILIKCYHKNLVGTYNIASRDVIDKYTFGIKTANKFGYSVKNIIKSEIKYDNSSTLQRALTLGLDVSKIENALDVKMPTINETLEELYNEYKEEHEQ